MQAESPSQNICFLTENVSVGVLFLQFALTLHTSFSHTAKIPVPLILGSLDCVWSCHQVVILLGFYLDSGPCSLASTMHCQDNFPAKKAKSQLLLCHCYFLLNSAAISFPDINEINCNISAKLACSPCCMSSFTLTLNLSSTTSKGKENFTP